MDIHDFRGISTVVWLLLFLGICAWAWSKRRQSDFEATAALPLQEDSAPDQFEHTDNREDR
ncbi:MAG TPA: cbb3-type cytochrome c oxidase subunit 3 [Woeseiaceae bacterium]|jgi:cytochrome c oxidase cbb3-type subunit 4